MLFFDSFFGSNGVTTSNDLTWHDDCVYDQFVINVESRSLRGAYMVKWLISRCVVAVSFAVIGFAGNCHAEDSSKVLRIVPQADLKILDPIWTTAFVSRNHGYMVYDQLFGIDAKGQIQPQMVDTYTKSPDFKEWTFTLRKGLSFSDGQPVTSEDVIASVNRWAKRDVFGQVMATQLDKFEAIDANSFKMTLIGNLTKIKL